MRAVQPAGVLGDINLPILHSTVTRDAWTEVLNTGDYNLFVPTAEVRLPEISFRDGRNDKAEVFISLDLFGDNSDITPPDVPDNVSSPSVGTVILTEDEPSFKTTLSSSEAINVRWLGEYEYANDSDLYVVVVLAESP